MTTPKNVTGQPDHSAGRSSSCLSAIRKWLARMWKAVGAFFAGSGASFLSQVQNVDWDSGVTRTTLVTLASGLLSALVVYAMPSNKTT